METWTEGSQVPWSTWGGEAASRSEAGVAHRGRGGVNTARQNGLFFQSDRDILKGLEGLLLLFLGK